jgi:hypothetical protein
MARFEFECWSCGNVVEVEAVFRSDTCGHCDADMKVCKNCRHYEVSASNECRETSADYVSNKERANFCGYFAARQDRLERTDEAAAARTKLAALFGDD